MSSSLRHLRPGSVILTAALFVGAVASAAQGQCEAARLSPSKEGNDFGRSVSVFGDLAVVGNTISLDSPVGTATVFRYDFDGSGQWFPEAQLTAPTKQVSHDAFGRAVAIRGDVIVIGAYGTDAPEFQSGAAYIFRYDPGKKRCQEPFLLP